MRIDQIGWQDLISCTPDTPIMTVRALLDLHHVDGLLLIDGGLVMGSFDRSDLSRQELFRGAKSDRQPIGPYARGCTASVVPEMDAETALTTMARHRCSVLPVKQNGKIVGMVTRSYLANAGTEIAS